VLRTRLAEAQLAREALQPDVLELRPHRLTRVELQGDDPVLERQLRLAIGEVHRLNAVDELLDVVALGDDGVLVPVVELERLLEFLRRAGPAGDGLFTVLPDGPLADEADAAALAAFVVNESGDARQLDLVADFPLIPVDHPLVIDLAVGDVAGAVLDAGIVGRVEAELQPQLEIAGRAAFPDETGV